MRDMFFFSSVCLIIRNRHIMSVVCLYSFVAPEIAKWRNILFRYLFYRILVVHTIIESIALRSTTSMNWRMHRIYIYWAAILPQHSHIHLDMKLVVVDSMRWRVRSGSSCNSDNGYTAGGIPNGPSGFLHDHCAQHTAQCALIAGRNCAQSSRHPHDLSLSCVVSIMTKANVPIVYIYIYIYIVYPTKPNAAQQTTKQKQTHKSNERETEQKKITYRRKDRCIRWKFASIRR